MAENVELKFPFGEEEPRSAAWPVEQEPTDLLALWPGESQSNEPPTQTEVIAALGSYLGDSFTPLEDADVPSSDICWAMAARIEGLTVPVMIWAQEATPVAPGQLGDPAAESCKWAIGFETLLDASDPLDSYITLMRTIARALPESPAVIDINSTMIHHRARLDEAFSDEDRDHEAEPIDPAADDLWMIHAVQANEEGSATQDGRPMWLHTHGLWRCGLPELEMLEVPAKHASTAAQLLNDIAALMLEFPPCAAGEPYEIGDDLVVALYPWQRAIECIDPASPGGASDRQTTDGDVSHARVRAVVCGTDMQCGWPKDVIKRLEDDEATIYMTARATLRQAKLARSRWDQFATAFATSQRAALLDGEEPRAVFLVKAGFAMDDEAVEDRREHLWIEVRGFQADNACGRLINQPVSVAAMKRGDEVRVSRSQISDWQVQTSMGSFGPHNPSMLWRTLDALREEANNRTDGTRARES